MSLEGDFISILYWLLPCVKDPTSLKEIGLCDPLSQSGCRLCYHVALHTILCLRCSAAWWINLHLASPISLTPLSLAMSMCSVMKKNPTSFSDSCYYQRLEELSIEKAWIYMAKLYWMDLYLCKSCMMCWCFPHQGFPYSGTANHNECYCGNTYNNYGQAPESACNRPCAGNPDQVCGGDMTLSVYVTGKPLQWISKHTLREF